MIFIKPYKLFIIFTGVMIMMARNSYAKSSTKISLEQASEQIRKQSKGKVLSAKTKRTINGERIHEIKILTPNGRVKTHSVRARKSLQNNNFSVNNKNGVDTFRAPNQTRTTTSNSNSTSKSKK
jgi:hypothetical protein